MISSTRYRALTEINQQTELSKQIAQLQDSVSTGKRLSAASDDPAAAARISDIRQTQADQVVWTNNVNMGTSISSAVDSSLSSISTLLNRAKELVLSGRNDTTSTTDRTAITTELQSIVTSLNSASTATDPTGAPLYPTTTPLAIPVSDTLSLPATASRDSVFGNIATANGTQSIQDIINGAITAINGDSATRATDIQTSLDSLDAATAHITQVQADQGVREQRFTAASDALNDSGTDLATERSGLEDTDLTYALSEFQSKQTSLQAAQTLFAQTNKSTLFDLLG